MNGKLLNDMWVSPKQLDFFPEDSDYVIFLDENGDSNMKWIINNFDENAEPPKDYSSFCLTGILMKKEAFYHASNTLTELKKKYWKDGLYKYSESDMERVCFHSREIRRRTDAFSNNVIDFDAFIADLSVALESLDMTVYSVFINKYYHYYYYREKAKPVYSLAVEFILERILNQSTGNNCFTVMLEARASGKKEDVDVLNDIRSIKMKGTYYVSSRMFKQIKYVSFNPKRPRENLKVSYVGLEIADLCSYPIYNYCKGNRTGRDFKMIEKKFGNYPNYKGIGLKIFP